MTRVTVAAVRRALGAAPATRLPPPPTARDHAAVALVLAGGDADLAIAVIRRTERPDDRWSGQFALPGGRGDATDPHPRATAERETQEEVGVHLDATHHLGTLPDIRLRRPGLAVHGLLTPYVYYVGPTPPALRPDPAEVDAAWWIPLAHCWSPAQWVTHTWHDPDVARTFPAIRWEGGAIWGLTYRVLIEFGQQLGLPPLPAYERP